ncbi:hypothetical protein LCGC14_2140840, partial [marine sediment metagenome]
IYREQNKLIESLRGENWLVHKEHRRDIALLDWADGAGHYDARFDSIRNELRSAMEEKMGCSKCGGQVVKSGSDAYRIFYRCVDCGKIVVITKT